MLKKIFLSLALVLTSAFSLHAESNPTAYRSETVETVSGVVEEIEKIEVPGNKLEVLRLTIQTDEGPLSVRLGANRLVEQLNLKFNKGDKVEVTGSRITVKDKPSMIAAEIKKDGVTFKLRDTGTGVPVEP